MNDCFMITIMSVGSCVLFGFSSVGVQSYLYGYFVYDRFCMLVCYFFLIVRCNNNNNNNEDDNGDNNDFLSVCLLERKKSSNTTCSLCTLDQIFVYRFDAFAI